METMVEAPTRQSIALPSISHLDSAKLKHDDDYRPRQTIPSPPVFRSGSTPYGQPSTSGLMSPPNSRRTSSEEQRSYPQQSAAVPARQSLPSIHEALGRDSALNYHGPPPPPPPTAVPTSSSAYFSQPTATAPPADALRRDSPPFHGPPSFSGPPPPPRRTSVPNGPSHGLSGPSPSFPSHVPKITSLQPIRTGNSPPIANGRPNGHYAPSSASSGYEQSPHSAPVYPPPGYPGYQSHYRPSTTAPAPYNTPPAVMSAPPQYSGWTGEPGSRSPLKPLRAHDSSVKRGLDQFDLEASLYEIDTNGTGFIENARQCAKRARHGKSEGDMATYVPTPEDIQQMATFMANMQRAFHRMQEISDAHHAEAQQYEKEMNKHYAGIGESNGYMTDPHGNGAVMPPDSKKRRGRAAPPGRCHSCNRAETPEWRRGPDGARTLCNACGLHYAKLTRKMGPQQKANISSSNLRPKGV